MTLNLGMRDSLRWAACLAVVIVHWFVFVGVAEWYITAYVQPRTGFYFSNPMSLLLGFGPVISLILIAVGSFAIRQRTSWARGLLAAWLVAGAVVTILAAIVEITAGREFLPDVVCIVWLFVFHALVIFAMVTTRS